MEYIQARHCNSIQLKAVQSSLFNVVLITLYQVLNIERPVRPVGPRDILLSGKKECLGQVNMACIYHANGSINK